MTDDDAATPSVPALTPGAQAAGTARPSRGRKPEQERHFVTALGRGLEVLRCFSADAPLLGNQEIAARVGLPKSTVSRLTGTLTTLGYLRWAPAQGCYELGAAMLGLGRPQLASARLRRMARPLMQALADHARASVSMGVQDRSSMLYVENCRSVAAVTLSAEVGARIPLATTAMGRAYLCGAPPAERAALLAQLRSEHGADWPRLEAGIEVSLRCFQRSGYCMSLGEWYEDVHAVAVPMAPADGSQGVVFSVGGPAYQLLGSVIEQDIGPRLVKLVRTVEAQFRAPQGLAPAAWDPAALNPSVEGTPAGPGPAAQRSRHRRPNP